jgi:hypothetical protein
MSWSFIRLLYKYNDVRKLQRRRNLPAYVLLDCQHTLITGSNQFLIFLVLQTRSYKHMCENNHCARRSSRYCTSKSHVVFVQLPCHYLSLRYRSQSSLGFPPLLQGGSYLYWPVHGSTLHDDRCTAGCVAHTNFTGGSLYLTADNIWN